MCLIAAAGVLVLGGAIVVPASGVGSSGLPAAVSIGQSDPVPPVGSRSAEEQRREPDPELVPLAEQEERPAVPADKYAMAGGCYAIEDVANGKWIVTSDDGYAASADAKSDASGFHFQASDLGTYLLLDPDSQFMARSSGVSPADKPSADAEWPVSKDGTVFHIGADDAALQLDGDGAVAATSDGDASDLALHTTTGCAQWPEADVGADGPTFKGTSPVSGVRGYIDDHIHHMAFDFLGGGIHCGQPWHKYGVAYALKDCADHRATDGKLALPEMILSGRTEHDPSGWPDFEGWPTHDSLTHEGTYYKWVERAWRGGLRITVNLLVQNEVLCMIYPNLGNPPATLTKNCNDMATIKKQAKQTRQLQNYIDAQWGGPGKGWYRIVESPAEARKVINEGKLAVILGTESSDVFNCSKLNSVFELTEKTGLNDVLDEVDPYRCNQADIDAGLDELDDLGVRQMVMTHKFDNAFGGTKGDGGFNGIATNLGNAIQTGSFLGMRKCKDGEAHDNAQLRLEDIPQKQMAQLGQIFGPLAEAELPIALPLYTNGPQCNRRGLTDLGEYMVRQMAERDMIVDVDHFSAKARSEALDVLEDMNYSGVISSHTWADEQALPRVYKLGGFVGRMANSSTSYAEQWKNMTKIMDGRYFWGIGYASDINGLASQGGPREDGGNPVTYPYTAMGGVKMRQQHTGNRDFDINTDGVAHYGLYPDWIEDLKHIAGQDIVADMQRGSEAYLQMWERARGVSNDACRQPGLRQQASQFKQIEPGMSATQVLHEYGQPHRRDGNEFAYCALDGDKATTVTVQFDGQNVAAAASASDSKPADGAADSSGQSGAASGSQKPGTASNGGSADETGTSGGSAESRASDLPTTGGPGLPQLLAGIFALLAGVVIVERSRRFGRP